MGLQPPSVQQTALISPHPGHGPDRETGLQGVCCLEFKVLQKYMGLSAFPEHAEPRLQWRDYAERCMVLGFYPRLGHPLLR